MSQSVEILKIAEIHAQHIKDAINKLQDLFPISEQKVAIRSLEEIVWLEGLVYRLGKLQDYMGNKVINLFFEVLGTSVERLTMLEKLHQLEKLGIMDDAKLWLKMRNMRKHLEHEDPNYPELTAKYLNEAFEMAPQLLLLLNNLKARL